MLVKSVLQLNRNRKFAISITYSVCPKKGEMFWNHFITLSFSITIIWILCEYINRYLEKGVFVQVKCCKIYNDLWNIYTEERFESIKNSTQKQNYKTPSTH